jgi:hypothetical protein
MRKILIALSVMFLAAPVWATINVNCTVLDLGSDPNYTVEVSYTVTGGDSNLPRAFGITIDVNNGAAVSGIDVNDTDYYIFPGSIDINDSNGAVNGWGSAIVDYNSNPNGGFTLEMGSLYATGDPYGHETAPPSSGTLCTFDVSKECVVSLSRDTDRGGVVMEDGADYATLNGCTVAYDNCFPLGHTDWAQYDAMGRPNCWCYPRQCHGDADGIKNSEFMKLDHWVGLPDLQILAIGWLQPDEDPNFSTFICADFNHRAETQFGIPYTFRVGLPDLQELSTYWKGPNDGKPDPNADCLD